MLSSVQLRCETSWLPTNHTRIDRIRSVPQNVTIGNLESLHADTDEYRCETQPALIMQFGIILAMIAIARNRQASHLFELTKVGLSTRYTHLLGRSTSDLSRAR